MDKSNEFYGSCIQDFQELTKKPTRFLQADEDLCNEIKNKLKKFYDFTKSEEVKVLKTNALSKLLVQNFDLEQIWQQIELQNESVISPSLTVVSKLIVNKAGLLLGDKPQTLSEQTEDDESVLEEGDAIVENESEEDKDDEIEDFDVLESDSDNEPEHKPVKFKKGSVVDDEFFKLSEMEKFLEAEEKKMDNPDSGNDSEESDEEQEDKDSVDLFEDGSDEDEDVEQAKYKDFFELQEDPKKSKNKPMRELEEADYKSSHELKQHRLNKKIEQFEQQALDDKSWQLKGEITATNRPQNSLLQEVVEFDLSTRPAPVITEQTTMQLEDIIKQRIRDKVFDSVERKLKPTETPLEYKKKLVLDQEKSKESLAQIYEKDFLQQQASLSKEEQEEKEPELHQEINSLMRNLFMKLDALCNFHFTPRAAVPDVKIISNLPAINIEEVAPVATSDAALLAPEEVKSSKRDEIGKTERTTTDKKRERRKKKLKQKIHSKAKMKKEQVMGKKFSKQKANQLVERVTKEGNVNKMSSNVKTVRSSKAFFSQLEEEVKSQIKRKADGKPKNETKKHSAKKLKL